MSDEFFWRSIPPEYLWLTADFHGMTAVHTGKPTYNDIAARWTPPAGAKRLDLSLLKDPPREKANTTLMVRPGHDPFTGVKLPVAPPVKPPEPPAPEPVKPVAIVVNETSGINTVSCVDVLKTATVTYNSSHEAPLTPSEILPVLADLMNLVELMAGSLLAVALHTSPAPNPTMIRQVSGLSHQIEAVRKQLKGLSRWGEG